MGKLRKKPVRFRTKVFVVVIALSAFSYALFFSDFSSVKLKKESKILADKHKKLALIRLNADSVSAKIDSLKNDLSYVERIAREDLKMQAPDEIVFRELEEKDQ